MSRSKTAANSPAPATTNDVASQLDAIEKSLASVATLTTKQRKQLESRSASVPDALITKMIQIAANNGGLVAGMPFDGAAASTVLTQVSDSVAAVASSRSITQKVVDDSLVQRVVVADRVFAIYRALGRLVKTPEGSPLARTYEAMAATVNTRPRKPRAKKPAAATATATPTTEPTTAPEPSPAPVAAPAPAVVVTPAASGASHS